MLPAGPSRVRRFGSYRLTKNRKKLRKAANGLVKPVAKELEELTGKPYAAAFEEIWQHYEEHMLERFPYIGGDSVSGTGNLTGFAYNKRSLTSRRLRRLDAYASAKKHGLSNQVIDAKQLGDLRSGQ